MKSAPSAPASPSTDPVSGPSILLPSGARVVPGKLVCIGRNYAAHARELGNEVPDAPVVFLKPATSLVADGGAIALPPQTRDVHHEIELVAVIGTACKNVSAEEALAHVAGYAVGIDLSARDWQMNPKHPWKFDLFTGKSFDDSCPLGPKIVPARFVDPGRCNCSCA